MTRILVVEDEDALREIYVLLFAKQKFDVDEAANGQIALERVQEAAPDVIVLDVLMPILDGIGFLKAAKLSENYPDIKVLMLSNLSDPKTVAECQKLGVKKYLLKASVSPGELVDAVKELL